MKKMLSSFVVVGSLTIGNISAVASEYITNTIDVITQFDSKEKIKKNPEKIAEYIDLLVKSDNEFKEKVIPFMLDNYKELNSHEFGEKLANIALYIKGKDHRYDVMVKLFKKDKKLISYNKKILQLKENNKQIKNKIQEVIDLVFLHIEAKGAFDIAKGIILTEKIENITLKDFWYTKDFEEENKVLFISIEQESDIDLDSIYNLEDAINEFVVKTAETKRETLKKLKIAQNSQVDEYNFEALGKTFFKRVSIV